MKSSLYDYMQNYHAQQYYPFHMPGHKRNPAFFPRDLLSLDVTEIPGMDNLHAPEDILSDLQQFIAGLYGAEESFFLVNGATAGLTASICAVCADGDPLYVARNGHASVFHAAALSGALPVYIMPETTEGGISGGVLPERFHAVTGAAVITSPTYEGYVSDVGAITDIVHQNNAVLIVDEAHGAHFPFHPSFPPSALSQGADIVVNSLHKTLPALSQCAVLHVQGSRVNRERLRYYLRAMQTSSPSYLFMAAADYMLHLLADNPSYFMDYTARLAGLRQRLPHGEDCAIRLVVPALSAQNGIFDADAGKLLLAVNTNLNGADLEALLAAEFNLQMEMSAGDYVLAMTSVADTEEGFNRLAEAVFTLNRRYAPSGRRRPLPPLPVPEMVLSPREAVRCASVRRPWPEALEGISAGFITPYPPGIPLLAPGERITQAVWDAATAYGLAAEKLSVITDRS